MSNLFKQGSIVRKDERVIDYNEIIRAKLQSIMDSSDSAAANPNNFVSGLNVDVVEELLADQEEGTTPEAALAAATAAAKADIDAQKAQAKNMQEAAEKMLAEANKKSDGIVADAKTQSMVIMNNAREQGYNEGMKQAEDEIAQHKAKLDADYAMHKQAVTKEYEQLKAQLEPEIVAVVSDLFTKVALTVAEDNKDIILHLVNGVLKNAENSREFIIKVAPEDYKFMINNQGKLYLAMNKEVSVDIVEDANLKHNECLVETDGGVFNCSLDIELNNLVKKIKLLSCV